MPIDSPGDFRRRMNATDGYALAIKTCVAAPGFGKEVDEMSRLLKAELPQLVADFPRFQPGSMGNRHVLQQLGAGVANSQRLSTDSRACFQQIDRDS